MQVEIPPEKAKYIGINFHTALLTTLNVLHWRTWCLTRHRWKELRRCCKRFARCGRRLWSLSRTPAGTRQSLGWPNWWWPCPCSGHGFFADPGRPRRNLLTSHAQALWHLLFPMSLSRLSCTEHFPSSPPRKSCICNLMRYEWCFKVLVFGSCPLPNHQGLSRGYGSNSYILQLPLEGQDFHWFSVTLKVDKSQIPWC